MSSFNLLRTTFRTVPWTARYHVQTRKFISTSSSVPELEIALREELTSRPSNVIYDDMSAVPSHLLNLSLSSFLPESCHPAGFYAEKGRRLIDLPFGEDSNQLPLGHHLIYFPAQVLNNQLLPDGTDDLQWPGAPFMRRMWAGGSVSFNNTGLSKLTLGDCSQRSSCEETVTDVRVKGVLGEEKVFVEIQRDILKSYHEGDAEMRLDLIERGLSQPLISETRNLVFMRAKSAEEVRLDASRIGRVVKGLSK